MDTDEDKAEIQSRPRGPGLAVFVAAGALSAAIGFGAAMLNPQFGWFADRDAEALMALRSDISALRAELAATGSDLAEAQAEAASLSNRLDTQAAEIQALAETAGAQAAQTADLAGLEARIVDLENRPIPDVGATRQAVDAYERELAAMREMLAGELARIEAAQSASAARQTENIALGRQAAIDAALARLQMAVEAGTPLAPTLADLKDMGVAIPEGLSAAAGGSPGLAALRRSFPDAARQAIEADIRRRSETGEIGRIEAFLRLQVGQRSLTPQPGDDADAVLSRVEAALAGGDLAAALGEVRVLSGLEAPLLREWIDQAAALAGLQEAVTALRAANDR